ncbi:MAG: endonuclease/exonuclease/phosphatase family protein [Myxococcota bacterium]
MLRIFTWNIQGHVEALQAALTHLGRPDAPATIAVLTEVPDARNLLHRDPKSGRRITTPEFRRWLQSVRATTPFKTWQGVIYMTAAGTTITPRGANQSHTAILSSCSRTLTYKNGANRFVRAELPGPFPIHVLGVHARYGRAAEDQLNLTAPFVFARALLESVENKQGLKIVAGDFNAEPFDRLLSDLKGYNSRSTRPRKPPMTHYWANLTWQAIKWRSTGTYWSKDARTWKWLDQILVDPVTAEQVVDVNVVERIDGKDPFSWSDHAPIEAILRLELEAE